MAVVHFHYDSVDKKVEEYADHIFLKEIYHSSIFQNEEYYLFKSLY